MAVQDEEGVGLSVMEYGEAITRYAVLTSTTHYTKDYIYYFLRKLKRFHVTLCHIGIDA